MINVLVCDDEKEWLKISQEQIERVSKKYSVNTSVHSYSQISEIPLIDIENKKIDIAYLDIDMGGEENGIDLAKKIQEHNKWAIIFFLTSHREFTKEAFFEVQAFGYLGKPIKHNIFENYFQKAVLQVISVKRKRITSVLEFYCDKLPVKLYQKDIIYIEKQNRKITIKTLRKSYQVYESIKQLKEKLDNSFLQISQSVIVNMKEIAMFDKTVCMKSGEEFSVGRTFQKSSKETYRNFTI